MSSPCDPLAPPERAAEVPGEPFALLVPGPHGDLIHGVNRAAAEAGLSVGARAADVAATMPELHTAYADLAHEIASLERLAAWCRRWSPLTRADGPCGVALDVTGCEHLFGGEAALLDAMGAAFTRQRLTARLACAPGYDAAHALARHSGEAVVSVSAGALAQTLAPLPISTLGLTNAAITLLHRLGLTTVGHIERTPRAALKRRFRKGRLHRDPRDDTWEQYGARLTQASSDVVARLDAVHARTWTPLDPDQETPPLRAPLGLAEPIFTADAVLHHTGQAVAALMGTLNAQGLGARRLGVEAFRTDGGRQTAEIRTAAPTRDVAHLMCLFEERICDWRAEFGFDALAVEALETASMTPAQTDGFAARSTADADALIDRLSTRLGAHAVTRPRLMDSHMPERAEAWVPALQGELQDTAWPLHDAPRPERLFATPEEAAVLYPVPDGPPARFTWRAKAHTVARAAGPERIAPEWWREKGSTRARDYYRVETIEGLRAWLYREGFEGDERGGHPRWFVHGLFS